MMREFRAVGLAAALLMMVPTVGLSNDGPPKAAEPAAGPHVPELAEMLGSILLHGADMGPGSGWFHPAEQRYDWAWLTDHFDHDGDGFVQASELPGARALFEDLDRDRDGVVSASDLDWSEGSPFLRQRAQARSQFARIDGDSNGKISREEWAAVFNTLARDKDFLSQDDLADLLAGAPIRAPRPEPSDKPGPEKPDPSRMMPTRWTLLKGLFQGEIGSPFEGPHVGELAPDFTLRTREGAPVTLSDFRGHQPVVLIFGSFT